MVWHKKYSKFLWFETYSRGSLIWHHRTHFWGSLIWHIRNTLEFLWFDVIKQQQPPTKKNTHKKQQQKKQNNNNNKKTKKTLEFLWFYIIKHTLEVLWFDIIKNTLEILWHHEKCSIKNNISVHTWFNSHFILTIFVFSFRCSCSCCFLPRCFLLETVELYRIFIVPYFFSPQ